MVEAGSPGSTRLAVRRADVIHVDAPDLASARRRRDDLRSSIESAGRDPDDVSVLLKVRIGEPDLRRRLDDLGGSNGSDGFEVVDRAAAVAQRLGDACADGVVDGFLVVVDLLPDGLDWLVDEVAAHWRTGGLLRGGVEGETLRDRLGLGRPENRYAAGTHP